LDSELPTLDELDETPVTNLLSQNEHQAQDGTYQPDHLYDQLTMMA
jgi:hypothetical protein